MKKAIKRNLKRNLKQVYLFVFFTFHFSLFTLYCYSNNIAISNLSLTGQNTTSHYTMVQFDISWDNSWRTSTFESNYDAAWVFVKWKLASSTVWNHATLNVGGHTAPSGSTIDTPNDGKGVFIYKSANSISSNNWTGAQLRWNYGADGVADNDLVEVCVMSIEMVYVPSGAYYLGDGTTSFITGQFQDGTSNSPFQVTSEAAITLGGSAAGNLRNNNATGMGTADDFNNTTTQTLPATFPKGINPYYIMKYEISQEQYAEFLNKLTRTQQANRMGTTTVGNFMSDVTTSTTPQFRNGVKLMSDPGGSTPRVYGCDLNNNGTAGDADDGQNIGCNYLSWADLAAYLDWSGLRPMTELEFEKACRGNQTVVTDEYAWGNTSITGATGISNSGFSNEIASNAGANGAYLGLVSGPMRVGNFAQAATNRQQSGGTYYGIMELSGNLDERAVSVGNATGRAFTGIDGDGMLDANGDANVTNWPTTSICAGFRGGVWDAVALLLRVSDRINAASVCNARTEYYNGRGVRTVCFAPASVTATATPNPVCAGNTLSLTGSATGATSWSWTGPNGFISTLQNPTITNITTAGAGVYTLTAINTCGYASVNTVSVTVSALPTNATNGSTQTICTTGNATLSGNNPAIGTGAWTVVSGPSTLSTQFASTSVYNTTFTPAGGAGSYVVRWTISNSPCTPSTADATITVNAPPTTATNGSTQTICTTGNATLSGNNPAIGTGAWTVVSGPSTLSTQFASTSVYNTTFTPAGGAGSYVVRWTISNSPCTPSTADATITVNTVPTAPTASTHTPSQTQIVWNWNTSTGATGYQWNTTTTYPGTGVNTVASPTYTQTGLTCNTAYTLYIWAYNACGNSATYTTLTQTTSACAGGCTSDSWAVTSTGANCPSARVSSTIWTGTEMIIWGGSNSTNTGAKYNPATDTWTATSTGANCPTGRFLHTAVWTGNEMIIWSGYSAGNFTNTGGRYNPVTDTWTATSIGANVPAGRGLHTAVWTGTEMVVWGGDDNNNYLNDGGRYNPSTDMWTATNTGVGCPGTRAMHTAVWTGTEMIVWGGVDYNYNYLNDGSKYNPSTDSWAATSIAGACPSGRNFHTAVWTGNEMIVWGGSDGSDANTGAKYNPSTNTWVATSVGANVPTARTYHSAVWTTCNEMIVWGGQDAVAYLNTGGRYNPTTNLWTATSTGANCPSARKEHSIVWTGTEMIVWGGSISVSPWVINTGGRYTP